MKNEIPLSAAIQKAAGLLNRPVHYTDESGYEHEIVGAAVEEKGARVAWVEGRSKQVQPNLMEVEFRLRAQEAGKELLDWEVATYNPYFGCEVGAMEWRGDQVLVVYREKHVTLAAVAPLKGPVRLLPIHDEWSLSTQALYYPSDEPDLIDVLQVPELVQCLPMGADALSKLPAPLTLALPGDAAGFQQELKAALFPSSSLQLEAELILGALGYRFWHRWPMAGSVYTSGRRPWHSPCWLPFYWHATLSPQDQRTFLRLLDEVGSRRADPDPTPVSIASAYIAGRCAALAAACRAGKLPEQARCYFWVAWAEQGFAKDLDLFPVGLKRAFHQLRPLASRWRAF